MRMDCAARSASSARLSDPPPPWAVCCHESDSAEGGPGPGTGAGADAGAGASDRSLATTEFLLALRLRLACCDGVGALYGDGPGGLPPCWPLPPRPLFVADGC